MVLNPDFLKEKGPVNACDGYRIEVRKYQNLHCCTKWVQYQRPLGAIHWLWKKRPPKIPFLQSIIYEEKEKKFLEWEASLAARLTLYVQLNFKYHFVLCRRNTIQPVTISLKKRYLLILTTNSKLLMSIKYIFLLLKHLFRIKWLLTIM